MASGPARSDTSVLVDLERGGLLEASFGLPYRFVVPDLLYERELREHGGDVLIGLGLVVADLPGEQVELAQTYKREQPALSSPDVFVVALAKTEGGTLLTGDKRMRSFAAQRRIACHGLLWLIDQMYLEGIAGEALVAGLQAIRVHPRCRLPSREVNDRLARYAMAAPPCADPPGG